MKNQSEFENGWTNVDINKYDIRGRNIFRPANSGLVRSYFKMYIKPEDKIFEIGSGLGELAKLVPEYNDRLIQTEQSTRISSVNKRANPNTNIIAANTYNLPFSDRSFNTAIGYSMLDTLADPKQAFQELSRVLKSKGKVIHFLDMGAAPYPLLTKYKNSEFKFVPYQEEDGAGIRLIPKKEWVDFIGKIEPSSLVGMLELFAKDPIYGFNYLDDKDPSGKIIGLLSQSAEKTASQTKVIKFNDFFASQLDEAADQNGFTVLESDKRSFMIDVPKEGVYTQKSGVNFYVSNLGHIHFSRLNGVSPNEVTVASTMHVFIAQKKE